MKPNLKRYLASSRYVDWNHPSVLGLARELGSGQSSDEDIAKACFEFVRDRIRHSWDYQQNPVTCSASEVLEHHTGYCYAKSHLLAALLRANGIPAGLCYQRLTVEEGKPPYCLHGLNAVHLKEYGWYRIDARGNKSGIGADFTPPVERLAFPVRFPGEADLPEIWDVPMSIVTDVLTQAQSYIEVVNNLPDIGLATVIGT